VASGGYPPGAPAAELSAAIAKLAVDIGARLVLDTSLAMRYAPEHGAYLMKPSERELARMVDRPVESRAEQIAAARSLLAEGRAEVIVVSLGAEGALLVTATLAEHFEPPAVPALSAVGAGDAMVGAMVFALEKGWSLVEAVRYGVAAGAATIMTPGTDLCYAADVDRLYGEMKRT
jgi:6-phosphofructokinase 2